MSTSDAPKQSTRGDQRRCTGGCTRTCTAPEWALASALGTPRAPSGPVSTSSFAVPPTVADGRVGGLGPSAPRERIARLSGRGVDEQVGALRGGPNDSSSCRRTPSSGRAVGQGTAAWSALLGGVPREHRWSRSRGRAARTRWPAGDRDAAPADRERLRRLRRVRRRGVGRSGEALRHHQLADLPGVARSTSQ
jgi:hypothetical protein